MNSEHILAQALLRAWPFPRGAGRIVDKFFGQTKVSKNRVSVKTTDGFRMTVNPNELIGRHIYLTGEFDRSIVEVLHNFSAPGDVLLDVGANIGYVSACFAALVPNSHVIAVEPQEGVIELLRENLPEKRSNLIPHALSDADGEVWFKTNGANNGAGRIVGADSMGAIRVKAISADTLFSEPALRMLDLVKIDAEGHEKAIISACFPHFHRLQPRAILFEDTAGDAASIAGQLGPIGYRTYGIRKSLMSLELVDSLEEHDCIAVSTQRQIPDRAKRAYNL